MERQLFLPLLITVVICKASHALTYEYYVLADVIDSVSQPLNMTWSAALKECRTGYSDMLTLDIMTPSTLTSISKGLSVIWMGLQRDTKNDSAWHWINTTIVDPSTGDFSQSLNWLDQGYSGHCAYYNSDTTWSSKRCAEKHPFFCLAKDITYHKTELSWHDARNVCHDEGGELPTITENVIKEKGYFVEGKGVFGWIGLYRVGGDTWMWAEGQSLSHTAWGIGEPVTNDCGAFNAVDKKWQSYPCDTRLNVLCFVDTLVVVHEKKTWEEALEHCQSLNQETCSVTSTCTSQYNLATVKSNFDYNHVGKRLSWATDEVWTGLRFLGGQWWWMNGEPLNELRFPNCPEYLNRCGALSKTKNGLTLTDCAKKLHFICQKNI